MKSNTLVAVAEPAPKPCPLPEVETPRPILASYVPEPAGCRRSSDAVAEAKIREAFPLCSVVGDSEPPRPSVGLSASPPDSSRSIRSAEVVGAPEADDDHPDELSYVPFEVASLMTERSITYNRKLGALTAPEQKDIAYLFEDMDRPLALNFRPSSGYQGLAAAQSFSGQAVKSFYAELEAPRRPSSLPTPTARLSDRQGLRRPRSPSPPCRAHGDKCRARPLPLSAYRRPACGCGSPP